MDIIKYLTTVSKYTDEAIDRYGEDTQSINLVTKTWVSKPVLDDVHSRILSKINCIYSDPMFYISGIKYYASFWMHSGNLMCKHEISGDLDDL